MVLDTSHAALTMPIIKPLHACWGALLIKGQRSLLAPPKLEVTQDPVHRNGSLSSGSVQVPSGTIAWPSCLLGGLRTELSAIVHILPDLETSVEAQKQQPSTGTHRERQGNAKGTAGPAIHSCRKGAASFMGVSLRNQHLASTPK